MERKQKKTPKSALHLYISLYCKKKNNSTSKYQSNVIEATKSWLSLTENEKLKFVNKLNECKEKYKIRVTDNLKSAEPYLKKKLSKRISNSQNAEIHTSGNHQDPETIEGKDLPQDNLLSMSFHEFHDTTAKTETEFDRSCWSEIPSQATLEEINKSESGIPQPEISQSLPEPTQPYVCSGEQLFNIVQTLEEENDKTWKTLTPIERRRYQHTVLTLKKNYITKLKTFLESLSSKDLYDYYNKHI